MDEPRDKNVPSVRCNILFNDGENYSEFCSVKESAIGKLEIELPNNSALLKKMLTSSSLSIIFENSFLRDGALTVLDFDLDPKNFARVASPIYRHLKNQD